MAASLETDSPFSSTPLSNEFDLAILGRGRVGETVGRQLSKKGWRIVYGVRQPRLLESRRSAGIERASIGSVEANGSEPAELSVTEAVDKAALILLAVPWKAAEGICKSRRWDGKTVVDCSNPLRSDFRGLQMGFDTSAAEHVASWAVGSDVVKTLNTASTLLMGEPHFRNEPATMFYCGGHETSQAAVARMLRDLGFDPFHCGPLEHARYLEPLAMLLIDMGMQGKLKGKFGLQLVRE